MSWSVGTVYTKPWFWKKVSEVVIDSELGCVNWVVMGVLTFLHSFTIKNTYKSEFLNVNSGNDVRVT